MTHLPNKHFNSYKEGLDLEFLREYCMEHGERCTFLRGETLEDAGEPAQWVAFMVRGCFKYVTRSYSKAGT
jgi:hypothetical protein